MFSKFQKSFPLVELFETNLLIYNALNFDQYSHLAISFVIFRFSANNSKMNLKFEESFSLFSRACRD